MMIAWELLKYRSGVLQEPSISSDEAEIDLTHQTKIQPLTSSTKIEEQYPTVQIAAEWTNDNFLVQISSNLVALP